MSFFLYNQDVSQAIARPYLDGQSIKGEPGPSTIDNHYVMPRYHQFDAWDKNTNAPNSNFLYDFEIYKFWVCDDWCEVCKHDENGQPLSGSLAVLEQAFVSGMEVKTVLRGYVMT